MYDIIIPTEYRKLKDFEVIEPTDLVFKDGSASWEKVKYSVGTPYIGNYMAPMIRKKKPIEYPKGSIKFLMDRLGYKV
jgi:hypothetical protein